MKTRLFLFLLFIFPFIHMQAQTYSTPTNFDIRLKNSKKVELNWDLSQGDSLPVSYRLKRNGETVDSLSGYSVAYVDSLSTDGKYTYQLTAFYGDNMSLEVEETPEALIGYALPIDFNYAISELFNVNLMWNLSEGEIYPIGYKLFRNEELITELSGYEVNSYIDLLLRDGTYNYKLMAVYEDDQTAFAENEPVVELEIEYGLPVNFSSIMEEENTVLFTWGVTNEENMPILFRLLRNEILIASIASNEFMYIDSNIKAGTSTYRLLADYENDTSITAEEDIVITVDYAIPSHFTYSIKNGNNVILDWMNLKRGIYPTSYQVMRNDEMIAEIAGESFSYADTNLSNGNYSYELIVYYGNDTNLTLALDSVVQITQTYAFPVNFKYVVDNYDVFLSWYLPYDDGILPLFYKMIRNGDTIATFSIDSNSFIDTGLALGLYSYQLMVYYPKDTIIKIEIDSILIINCYVIPTNLIHSIVNGNNVILSWAITGECILPELYQIERNDSIIDSISGIETMYIDTGLLLGQTYLYRLVVSYTDTSIIIEDTNSVTVTEIEEEEKYAVPRNFECNIENKDDVVLTWNVLDRGEQMRPLTYKILRNDSIITEIVEDSIRFFVIFDSNLMIGEYIFKLTTSYEDSTSITSEEISLFIDTSNQQIYIEEDEVFEQHFVDSGATFLSPPLNFSDTVQNNTVILTWEIPTGGAIPLTYKIERNNTVIAEVSGNTFTYSDVNLEIGTYVYRISAVFNENTIYTATDICIATILSCD